MVSPLVWRDGYNWLRRLNGVGMRLALGPMFRYYDAMKNPNAELLNLMRWHGLTQIDVAALCRCSRTTVHFYTRHPSLREFQKIKPAYLRLLKLELGEVRRQRSLGVRPRAD